ncbi:IS110 family transposase [Bacteroidota bacterium]
MRQFEGQNIYIGIDVHKKSWNISILGDYNEFKTYNQSPSSSALYKYVNKTFPGANYFAVYEAGFCGFGIYNELNSLSINTIIVNAADVPTTDKEKKQKTDRIDSRKLAKSLRAKQLTCIYVPNKETLEDRAILRYRNKLVGDQTRCKNRIKSFLYFHNILIPEEYDNSNWGKTYVNWLQDIAKEHWTLSLLVCQLKQTKEALRKTNRKLIEISKKKVYQKQFELIKSIPGIGNLSAIHILLEIDDIRRFKENDQLASFVGLTPTRHSSGDKERIGAITPRGNKLIKKYLIEASWIAVRKDPELMATFGRLCSRMLKTKAIIRIARKLLNRIKAVLETGQPYKLNYNL